MSKEKTDLNDDQTPLLRTQGDVWKYLHSLSGVPEEKLDLFETALALSSLFTPGISIDKYRQHLKKMAETVKEWMAVMCEEGVPDNAETRADVLSKVMFQEFGYQGDSQDYDNLENANLIRVIDRRKGLPVSLGILYLKMADLLGWDMQGLSFPGHFIVSLTQEADRLILDPFRLGQKLGAPELRQILKAVIGEYAELSADYYQPVGNREILIRLENNIKTRLIEQEEYHKAIEVVDAMLAFAPEEYRLYLDSGVLRAKTEQLPEAISALETYSSLTPYPEEQYEADKLIQQILYEMD